MGILCLFSNGQVLSWCLLGYHITFTSNGNKKLHMGMVGAKHHHMQMNMKKMMDHNLWPDYVVGILALFELVY